MSVGRTVLDLVTLPMRPWRLGAVAASVPVPVAVCACLIGCAACSGFIFGAGVAATEPVRGTAAHLGDWMYLSLCAAVGTGLVVCAPLGALLGGWAGLKRALWPARPRPDPMGEATASLFLLVPLCCILPVGLWSMGLAFATVLEASPTGRGVPAPYARALFWVCAVGVPPAGLVGLMALLIWQSRVAGSIAARRLAEELRRCGSCGYDLLGLRAGEPCPECGAASQGKPSWGTPSGAAP